MLDKSTVALVPEHITETLNLPFSSISLLGKPPHSSIMTMATGKNLTSIPKKVGAPQFKLSTRSSLHLCPGVDA